jgi:hypothetical protein
VPGPESKAKPGCQFSHVEGGSYFGSPSPNGALASEVVFTCKQGQYILKLREVWAVENNKAYTISFCGEESKYTNYQEIVDQMIDSFEIY